MPTLANSISAAMSAVGEDMSTLSKMLNEGGQDLSGLDTKDKTSLVNALNEVRGMMDSVLVQQHKSVAVDQEQELTVREQRQGCENLNIGDPTTDFTRIYETARST